MQLPQLVMLHYLCHGKYHFQKKYYHLHTFLPEMTSWVSPFQAFEWPKIASLFFTTGRRGRRETHSLSHCGSKQFENCSLPLSVSLWSSYLNSFLYRTFHLPEMNGCFFSSGASSSRTSLPYTMNHHLNQPNTTSFCIWIYKHTTDMLQLKNTMMTVLCWNQHSTWEGIYETPRLWWMLKWVLVRKTLSGSRQKSTLLDLDAAVFWEQYKAAYAIYSLSISLLTIRLLIKLNSSSADTLNSTKHDCIFLCISNNTSVVIKYI